MRWKTTLFLLVLTVGVGAYISLYEIRQPSPEQRQRLAKQILNVQPEAVTQLVLDLPKANVTLTREGINWTLAPNGVRADHELIGRILSALAPLEAERTFTTSDLKTYGLEPAVGWLSVVTRETPTTLLFGGTTAVKSNRYAKVANRPEVFVIASTAFETANVAPETFRDPILFRFNSWMIDEMQLSSPAATFTLTRQADHWTLTQPLSDRADRSEVSVVQTALAGIRIKRFVDDAPKVEHLTQWGFDHAKAEVTLRQKEGSKAVTLFFGNALPDDATLVYAKRSDEPALYAVAAADVETLVKKDVMSLRAKACFEFFTSDVTKVELMREGRSWAMERAESKAPAGQEPAGAQWQVQGTGELLDTGRVEDVLGKLADMRVEGFLDEAQPDLARYGLQSPVGAIAVWTQGQEAPQRLFIGSAATGLPDVYGRIEGRSPIVTLPNAVTELLATTADQLRSSPPPTTTPARPTPNPTLKTPAHANQK